MKAILVNHNYDPIWLKDYDLDVTLYDRSDDGEEYNLQQYGAVYKTRNIGDVDYDKLSYLIENYDALPDVFLWGKSNLLKYVDEATLKAALEKQEFAPLLKKDHHVYEDRFGHVNKYDGKIYWERIGVTNGLFHTGLDQMHVGSWEEWALNMGLPIEAYIPFAPGGNYVLTRDRVRRYGKEFYEKMRSALPYAAHPVEAHMAERTYFSLWS